MVTSDLMERGSVTLGDLWTGLFLRYVLLWRGSAFAEEILLHLLDDGLLVFSASRIQTILVEQHFAEFGPALPRLLRNVFVNLLAKFRVKRWLIQSRKLLVQLDTENRAFSHISPQQSF